MEKEISLIENKQLRILFSNMIRKSLNNDYKFNDLILDSQKNNDCCMLVKVRSDYVLGVCNVKKENINQIYKKCNEGVYDGSLLRTIKNLNGVLFHPESSEEWINSQLKKEILESDHVVFFQMKDLNLITDHNGDVLNRKDITLEKIKEMSDQSISKNFNSLIFITEVIKKLPYSDLEEEIINELFYRVENICHEEKEYQGLHFEVLKNGKEAEGSIHGSIVLIKTNEMSLGICKVDTIFLNKFVIFDNVKFAEIIDDLIVKTDILKFIKNESVDNILYRDFKDFNDNPLLFLEECFGFSLSDEQ